MSQIGLSFPSNFPQGFVQTITGNTGGAVPPAFGNINFVGDGTYITIAGDPSDNTLTASLINGGTFATSFVTDSGTAVPASGVIDIKGGSTGLTTTGSGNAINLTGTLAIAHGGTNATSMTNTDGVVYFDGTRLVTTAVGTSTYVLTSNGTGMAPTFQASAGSGIEIIDGDSGSITGSTVTISGGSTGLTTSGSGTTMDLTGTLVVSNGGTGAVTFTSHGVLLGNTTGAITATTAGTTGQVLTGVTGSAPTFQSPAASSISITGDSGGALVGNAFTFTGGSTGLTFSGATATETLTGTLIVANGGTGNTTFTTYAPVCGGITSTGIFQSADSGISNSGYVLTSTGSSSLPTWQAAGGGSGITTINGDSGSATGSTVTINAATDGLARFTGSGATLALGFNFGTRCLVLGGGGAGNAASISGADNTGIGYGCFANTTSGSENTAIGSATSSNITTGIRNAFVGRQAGTNMITGSYNALFGYLAGSNLGGGNADSSNIAINSPGVGATNNACWIGAGTGTGTQQLNKTYICGIQGITVTGTAVLVSSSDQLGIAVSSRNYKENILDMGNLSQNILKLRPVKFNYKEGEDRSQQTGLIAEEVHDVMPSLVAYDKKGDPQSVKYHDLPALLLNELQKTLKRIDALERQIASR